MLVESRNRIIRPKPDGITIKNAITDRKYVGIYYEDESDEVLNGFRLIEPYAYGFGFVTNNGDLINTSTEYLRAYILKDGTGVKFPKNINRRTVSLTNRAPYWRLFRVDRISDWFTFSYKFSRYRELYNPDDKTIGYVATSLPYTEFPYGITK